LLKNSQSIVDFKIIIAITIAIENLIRINQGLIFIFQPDSGKNFFSRP